MSKLMMVATTLALVLVLSVPALAANVDGNISFDNSGDYARQCGPTGQTGNVGNFKEKEEFTQEYSTSDDFASDGTAATFEPTSTTTCPRVLEQSSAGSS